MLVVEFQDATKSNGANHDENEPKLKKSLEITGQKFQNSPKIGLHPSKKRLSTWQFSSVSDIRVPKSS